MQFPEFVIPSFLTSMYPAQWFITLSSKDATTGVGLCCSYAHGFGLDQAAYVELRTTEPGPIVVGLLDNPDIIKMEQLEILSPRVTYNLSTLRATSSLKDVPLGAILITMDDKFLCVRSTANERFFVSLSNGEYWNDPVGLCAYTSVWQIFSVSGDREEHIFDSMKLKR